MTSFASDFVVIGAGPAGIGTALGLGGRVVVLEKRHEVGGLSGSIQVDGAVFDVGGHSFHTPHEHVRKLVYGAVEMYEQRRDARCFVDGALIAYPFQKNFRSLPDARVVEECAEGLKRVDDGKGAANFQDHLEGRFGPGIAKHFLLPYNRKLWGEDLGRMSADWTAERVAAPEGKTESFETRGGARKPLQADTTVAYPAQGGFGEIYRALSKPIKEIRLSSAVTRVDVRKREVVTHAGDVYSYKTLISTIPLPELVAVLGAVPEVVAAAAARLDYLSMKVVLVVVGHPVDTEIQRVYAASPDIAAHKIAMNHNSSDFLRRLPHHGIMCEVSHGAHKKLHREDLDQWVVEDLVKLGLIGSANQVVRTKVLSLKYAYPVPTHDRSDCVRELKRWLETLGIFSVGRFGEWAYVNSDECLHRGLDLGRRLANDDEGHAARR